MAAGLALLVTVGCQSSGTSLATSASPTTTTAVTLLAAPAVEQAGGGVLGFVESLWPFSQPSGLEAQRAAMREQAGTEHFRNPDLAAAKAKFRLAHHAPFEERRDRFVSAQLTDARANFRNGGGAPRSGPVLGPALSASLRDPEVARALIAAAVAAGGNATVQPVLATLLPAFGN